MKLIPEHDFPELQRDPKSGIWYIRKYVTGKGELCKSTKERRSKNKAKTVGLRILSSFLERPVQGHVWQFKDIAADVIKLKANKSRATQESARIHITKHLMPYFGHMRLDHINETIWEAYVVDCHLKSPARKLFNDFKHMTMVMLHAYRKGLIQRPLQFKNPDPKTEVGKVYSQEEISRLLFEANPELKLQILMAITMGMRRSEILLLSWDRVDLPNRVIHLRNQDTKIRSGRSIGISPQVLQSLMARERVSQWVFSYQKDKSKPTRSHKTAWGLCKKRAAVEGRFHDLRHTFISRSLILFKKNPMQVARYCGVSVRVIESVYLHTNVEDTREIAQVVEDISCLSADGPSDSESFGEKF